MSSPVRARFRRRVAASAVALALIVAAGCSDGDDDTAPSTTLTPTTTVPQRESDGVLTLGAFLPLTGSGATLGPPMIEAMIEAIDTINEAGGVLGATVELRRADEASGTIDELLDQGVDAIIGPASSRLALSSLRPAVDPNTGVVVCSPMATTIALDDYRTNSLFFRTAPSDSLQMAAIASEADGTGAQRAAVGYLDDPYGRGLRDAFVDEVADHPLPVVAEVGFEADQDDLTDAADQLLAADPGVIVVLGDADDGSRLLAALDTESREATADLPDVIVNDSIRQARGVIENLSPEFRSGLRGVAPRSGPAREDGPEGFFVAHAVDCVNLIALAALQAETDEPDAFKSQMTAVSQGGQGCTTFAACAEGIENNVNIDYRGVSGDVDLSSTTGNTVEAWFETFRFDADGNETDHSPIPIGY